MIETHVIVESKFTDQSNLSVNSHFNKLEVKDNPELQYFYPNISQYQIKKRKSSSVYKASSIRAEFGERPQPKGCDVESYLVQRL